MNLMETIDLNTCVHSGNCAFVNPNGSKECIQFPLACISHHLDNSKRIHAQVSYNHKATSQIDWQRTIVEHFLLKRCPLIIWRGPLKILLREQADQTTQPNNEPTKRSLQRAPLQILTYEFNPKKHY